MKFLLTFFLPLCTFNAEIVNISKAAYNVKGFYWRDYKGGEIPTDAFPGGKDDQGNPIFIGQTMFHDTCSIVAGQIRSKTKLMTLEMRKKEEPGNQDIKILCTAHPEQFQWIKSVDKTKVSTFLNGTQQFITAGFDINPAPERVAVGRASVGNELLIGKVILSAKDIFIGIHVGQSGKGFQTTSFEILVYDPSIPENTLCNSTTTVNIHIL